MKVSVKRIINAPAEVLWAYLADYSNIHRFHPMLSDSDFIEGAHTCEVGSTRRCDMKDGNYVKERITDWKEGSHYSIEIYETSMPVKEGAKATIGVRALGPDKSEAHMSMDVEPKVKLMQPMMYLMFKYQVAPSILKGLEDLYNEENQAAIAA